MYTLIWFLSGAEDGPSTIYINFSGAEEGSSSIYTPLSGVGEAEEVFIYTGLEPWF